MVVAALEGIVWILRHRRQNQSLLGIPAVWSLSTLTTGHRPNIAGIGARARALVARLEKHTARAALCSAIPVTMTVWMWK